METCGSNSQLPGDVVTFIINNVRASKAFVLPMRKRMSSVVVAGEGGPTPGSVQMCKFADVRMFRC